jgi:hypothetical protein
MTSLNSNSIPGQLYNTNYILTLSLKSLAFRLLLNYFCADDVVVAAVVLDVVVVVVIGQ